MPTKPSVRRGISSPSPSPGAGAAANELVDFDPARGHRRGCDGCPLRHRRRSDTPRRCSVAVVDAESACRSAKDGASTSAVGRTASWLEAPRRVPAAPILPETTAYRLKRRLLGRPLISEDLQAERLGKPTALAVLSSDVMSSCAYASESILRILVPAVGVAAFSLLTPVTGLLILVLGLVCVCYRQVVKAYPVSGGSYVVSVHV